MHVYLIHGFLLNKSDLHVVYTLNGCYFQQGITY